MHVILKTLGCRLNEAELENWGQQFQQHGHQITNDIEKADLVVINTCAVTQEAVKKSRQLIRRSQRHNPKAKLVVSGCYGSLHPELKDEIAGIDLIVSNQDKERLVERVQSELSVVAMPKAASEPGITTLFKRGRNRAFIKVQDGCRYQCTFCIVTVARGRERSKPIATVIDEINGLHAQGINEVILTGVHIGGYGSDRHSSLVELLQRVLEQTDIPRIRLGSVEPWDLGEGFLEMFTHPRLMPHLHLPMQSGADTVLRRMARRCKTKEFTHLLQQARQHCPDMNITTDMIVGFPAETEAEWQQTLDFVRRCAFSHIHIFPYSARSGTQAATLANQVDHKLKKQRCQELHVLAESLKNEFMQAQVGKNVAVLIEDDRLSHRAEPMYPGYTNNYLRVAISASECEHKLNQIIPVKLTHYIAAQQCLIGTSLG